MKKLAMMYAPLLHMDEAEPIPVRAVGYTVFTEAAKSQSFPNRIIQIPDGVKFVIEYAYYFDYDIEHMYDLEHIWIYVDPEGKVTDAEGSFHGKYLKLLPEISGVLPPTDNHVHAFCQPGKHAMLPIGELTRLYPGWDSCCRNAGGRILTGGPFEASHSPTGKPAFLPTEEEDLLCDWYLREKLAFAPTLQFREGWMPTPEQLMPWKELYELIPGWIEAECQRLREGRSMPPAGRQ